jgi:hypothetical protein
VSRSSSFAEQLLGPVDARGCCAALVGAVHALSGAAGSDAALVLSHFTRHGGWALLRALLQWRAAAAAAAAGGCASAMGKWRIVRVGFGTARQKTVLE